MHIILKSVISILIALAGAFSVSMAASQALGDDKMSGGYFLHPSLVLLDKIQADCMGASPCRAEAAQSLAQRLLTAAPAAGAPFLVIARADAARTKPAALMALQRNRRYPLAYGLLHETAVSEGDATTQLWAIERLLDLEALEPEAVTAIIAQLASTPDGMTAVEARLNAGVIWGGNVLHRLISTAPQPGRFMALARQYPQIQESIVMRLFQAGTPKQAFLAWMDTFPPGAPIDVTWPYDGDFTGKPGVPPFNWRFAQEGLERHSGGGVFVTFFGREPTDFATQVMMLQPGQYRLQVKVDGETARNGGALSWSIVCHPGGQVLSKLPLLDLSMQTKTIETRFERPAQNCDAQILRLRGEPGDFPTRARALTHAVAVLVDDGEAMQSASDLKPAPSSTKAAE